MTLEEAKQGVSLGLTFGSLYPMLDEIDRDDFRNWYVKNPDVPNLSRRKKEPVKVMAGCGYTGNSCPSCGSVRMVRTGICERCEDCGDSKSC